MSWALAGRVALGLLGVAALVLLVREVGTDPLARTLLRAGHWVPALLALEAAIALFELGALWELHRDHASGVTVGTWLRSTLVWYVSAQVLPGGRMLGEVLRAAALAPYVGRERAAWGALAAQGAHVFVASAAASVALLMLYGQSALFDALLGATCVWTLALACVLVLAPRSARLASFVARRAGLADAKLVGFSIAPRRMLRVLGWMGAARAVVVAQCVLVSSAVLEGSALGGAAPLYRAAAAAQGVQLVAANFGDAIPAQTGVLEGAFRAFWPLIAPSGVVGAAEAAALAASALCIALLLRMARLGLTLVAAAGQLITSAPQQVGVLGAVLLLAASAPASAQAQEGAPAEVSAVVRQRVVGIVNPEGAEHMISLGARQDLAPGGDALFAGAHIEGGALSYVSPIYTMSGGYLQLQPLAFLIVRAELLGVGLWPIGMDGAGFYPVEGDEADLQSGVLAAHGGQRATGFNAQLSAIVQLAIQLGPLRPIFWSQTTLEYEALGEQAFHFSPRYDVVLARHDWMVASSSMLMLEIQLDPHVGLRVGAYDDLRSVPRSGALSHVLGPVLMLALTDLDRAVPELLFFARAGAHLDDTRRAGDWTGLLGFIARYDP